MRFLCLHGRGCNNKIFEMQTALLRDELGDGHSFEFVEGTIPADAAPGVEHLLQPGEQCYAYYKGEAESYQTAVQGILEFLDEEGPFDAVLGFSQGASLAAASIIRHAKDDEEEGGSAASSPLFQCAIFCSAAGPIWHGHGEPKGLEPSEVGELIAIPTAHLFAENDADFHADSLKLLGLCSSDNRELFAHTSGHDIPRDAKATKKIVSMIKRTIERVQL